MDTLIDGVTEATRSITISPGGPATVSFTAVRNVAGAYNVDVNGLSGSFQVNTTGKPPGRKARNTGATCRVPAIAY